MRTNLAFWKAIDGFVFYIQIPDTCWTNNQSYHFIDTFEITLARRRTSSSSCHVLRSHGNGSAGYSSAIEVYSREALLANISNFIQHSLSNDRNTISFKREITRLSVSVNAVIKYDHAVGLARIEIWVAPSRGPSCYPADAYLTNAVLTLDAKSSATVQGLF